MFHRTPGMDQDPVDTAYYHEQICVLRDMGRLGDTLCLNLVVWVPTALSWQVHECALEFKGM